MSVSPDIISTIIELQNLPSLKNFYLGGGTNLALRYSHRESVDIDLFTEDKIGIKGFKSIEREINTHFSNRILFINYPTKQNDDLVFIRAIIRTNDTSIKVEIIQNFKLMFEKEVIEDLILASELDIALFKMESLCNRYAEKDLYDLDYITDKTNSSIDKLFKLYSNKKAIILKDNIKTIFNMDDSSICPIENPELLIIENSTKKNIPFHSESKILNPASSYQASKYKWRHKVNTYIRNNITTKKP